MSKRGQVGRGLRRWRWLLGVVALAVSAVGRGAGPDLLLHGDDGGQPSMFWYGYYATDQDFSAAARPVTNHGVKATSYPHRVFGVYGFDFDGTASLAMADAPEWRLPDAATIELRVSFRTLPQVNGESAVFFGQASPTAAWAFGIEAAEAGLRLFLRAQEAGVTTAEVLGAWSPAVEEWHHVGLLKEGAAVSLCVDGVAVGSGELAAPLPDVAADLCVGQGGDGTGFLDGYLDELAVWREVWLVPPFAPPAAAYANPVQYVNAMPAREAWEGAATPVWGNVNRGAQVPQGGSWEWALNVPPEVTVTGTGLTGLVDQRYPYAVYGQNDFPASLVFTLVPPATRAPVEAVLTVTDAYGNARSAATTVTVVAPGDPTADTPQKALEISRRIALEGGLYFLYRSLNPSWEQPLSGQYPGYFCWYSYSPWSFVSSCTSGPTGLGLWAFANAGHGPGKDAATDIYQPTAAKALEYVLRKSAYEPIGPTTYGGDPDTNQNGVGLLLGGESIYDAYERGMCLAALAACDTPLAVTRVGVFANGGNGTTFRDIVQDTVDLVATHLGNNPSPGWSYSYRVQSLDADNSVASWQVIGLEGAKAQGCTIPSWVPGRYQQLLAQTWQGNGAFGYYPGSGARDSGSLDASALAGLCFVAFDGRNPSPLEVGIMKLHNLGYIGGGWAWMGWDDWWHTSYGLWTMTRALRIANVTYLYSPTIGRFDWQRNLTAPEGQYEGIWPFLIRIQGTDGSIDLDVGAGGPLYGIYVSTTFGALCLTEGVIGERRLVHDVELCSTVPKNDALTIIRDTHASVVPEVTELDPMTWQLRWALGDVAEGSTLDLSYEQYLAHLQPGEVRRVEHQLVASYTSGASGILRQFFGPLDMAVRSSLFDLSVTSLAPIYQVGQTASFTVAVAVPPGQDFLRLDAPAAGVHRLEPAPDVAGATWTTLVWSLANASAFGPANVPVAVRCRSGATLAALATAPWSNPVTSSPAAIPAEPGRYLELDLALTPNGAGVLPQVDLLYVYFNRVPATVVVDVLGADEAVVATVGEFALTPSDYGQRVEQTRLWATGTTVAGDYRVRARLLQNGAEQARATDTFALAGSGGAGSLTGVLSCDRARYGANEPVLLSARVNNHDAHVDFRDLTATVTISGPDGQPVVGGTFAYAIALLRSGDHHDRQLLWFTDLQAPGTYPAAFTVAVPGLDPVTASTSFVIVASAELGEGLEGTIDAAPATVEGGTTFSIASSVRNSGNTDLVDLRLDRQVVAAADPTDRPAAGHDDGGPGQGRHHCLDVGGRTLHGSAARRVPHRPGGDPERAGRPRPGP